MFRRILFSLLAATMFLVGQQAQALSIDFRDSSFSFLNDQPSGVVVVDGITVTVEAIHGNLSWTASDGLGVAGCLDYEPDEIQHPEAVLLSFSEPIYLTELSFFDLYREGLFWAEYNERGSYSIDGGAAVWFEADAGAANGGLVLSLPAVAASTIRFTSPGLIWDDCQLQGHEFALAGLQATNVPEPASMMLLGMGLLGMAAVRRRRF